MWGEKKLRDAYLHAKNLVSATSQLMGALRQLVYFWKLAKLPIQPSPRSRHDHSAVLSVDVPHYDGDVDLRNTFLFQTEKVSTKISEVPGTGLVYMAGFLSGFVTMLALNWSKYMIATLRS